ncbi:MAG: type I glyceraldehyde-3-phosphate dehydrogenase [Cyclobacteriaceae bacterium]
MKNSKVKVAINGFGRIGRVSMRALLKKENVEVVAINDLTEPSTLAHLFKYDSVHGVFEGESVAEENGLRINGNSIPVYAEAKPENLPWKELGVEVVIESTGRFTAKDDAEKHIIAGAKKVVITAPAKGDVPTVVLGVNDDILKGDEPVVSVASCTTNSLAPLAKILDDNFGIESGFITTVHAYTADQKLHDAPHRDLRRARSAALSIIPTSTGAASAIGKVIPHLNGVLDGQALRVPIPAGSITDFTVKTKRETTVEEVNKAFAKAAEGPMKGVLEYVVDPIVSADIVGNTHSSIFDSELTMVKGNLIKVQGWYDNESGISNRIADLVSRF